MKDSGAIEFVLNEIHHLVLTVSLLWGDRHGHGGGAADENPKQVFFVVLSTAEYPNR
jgi:hypothetical protein